MGSTNEVREATVEDAAEIYALACELAETVGDAPPREEAVHQRLKELLEEPRACVLVAEAEDGVVGAASLWIKPDLAHGDAVVAAREFYRSLGFVEADVISLEFVGSPEDPPDPKE